MLQLFLHETDCVGKTSITVANQDCVTANSNQLSQILINSHPVYTRLKTG